MNTPFLTSKWGLIMLYLDNSDGDFSNDSDDDLDGYSDGEVAESDDSDAGHPQMSPAQLHNQLSANLPSDRQINATECTSFNASFEAKEGEAILGFTPCEHKNLCWRCVVRHVGTTYGETPRISTAAPKSKTSSSPKTMRQKSSSLLMTVSRDF